MSTIENNTETLIAIISDLKSYLNIDETNALQALVNTVNNGDESKMGIEDTISIVHNSVQNLQAFNDVMKIYINYEMLVKTQLEQLGDFINLVDLEDLGLSEINTSVTNIVNSYNETLEQNDIIAKRVSNKYDEIVERIKKLRNINYFIDNIIYQCKQLSFKKRYDYYNVNTFNVQYPIIKRLPTSIYLKNDSYTFVLKQYIFETPNTSYTITSNPYNSATIVTNSDNVQCLVVTGDNRGTVYNINVTVSNNNTTSQNKNIMLVFKIIEFLSHPIATQPTEIYTINGMYIFVDFAHLFTFFQSKNHFKLIKYSKLAIIVNDQLLIYRGYTDSILSFDIVAIDSTWRTSNILTIQAYDPPQRPNIISPISDIILYQDYEFDLASCFVSDYDLNIEYSLDTNLNQEGIFSLTNNILTIKSSFRNTSYNCTITATTTNARTINTSSEFTFKIIEFSSRPLINDNIIEPGLNVNELLWLINLPYSNDNIHKTINLNNLFSSSGSVVFNVLGDNAETYNHDTSTNILTLYNTFSERVVNIDVIATSFSNISTTLNIQCTQTKIPSPTVKKEFSTLYGGNLVFYDAKTANIDLSEHFTGYGFDYSLKEKMGLEYKLNIISNIDLNTKEYILNNVFKIVNGHLLINNDDFIKNTEVIIEIQAINYRFNQENQIASSQLIYHFDIPNITTTNQLIVENELLTNERKIYNLNNYFSSNLADVVLTYEVRYIRENNLEITDINVINNYTEIISNTLIIKPSFKNKSYDVGVVATATRFDNIQKTAKIDFRFKENIQPPITNEYLINTLYGDKTYFVPINNTHTFNVSTFFSGTVNAYNISIYDDFDLTKQTINYTNISFFSSLNSIIYTKE